MACTTQPIARSKEEETLPGASTQASICCRLSKRQPEHLATVDVPDDQIVIAIEYL